MPKQTDLPQAIEASTPLCTDKTISTSSTALPQEAVEELASQYHLSILLDLPAELKDHILALVIHSNGKLSILRTCHEIFQRALPMVYERPATFTSQDDFLAWSSRSLDRNLKRVTTLALRITSVDLTPLLSKPTRRTAWDIYQAELQSIDQAFGRLINLETVTIHPPRNLHCHFARALHKSVLSLISRRCPKAKVLQPELASAVSASTDAASPHDEHDKHG